MNESNIFRMLSIDEAAELLALSERTVRQMASDGELPSWRPGKSMVRIPYWLVILTISLHHGIEPETLAKLIPSGDVTKIVTMAQE